MNYLFSFIVHFSVGILFNFSLRQQVTLVFPMNHAFWSLCLCSLPPSNLGSSDDLLQLIACSRSNTVSGLSLQRPEAPQPWLSLKSAARQQVQCHDTTILSEAQSSHMDKPRGRKPRLQPVTLAWLLTASQVSGHLGSGFFNPLQPLLSGEQTHSGESSQPCQTCRRINSRQIEQLFQATSLQWFVTPW